MTDITIHLRAEASQLDRQLRASAVGIDRAMRQIERGMRKTLTALDRQLMKFAREGRDVASSFSAMERSVNGLSKATSKLSSGRGLSTLSRQAQNLNTQLARTPRLANSAAHGLAMHGGNLHIGQHGIGISSLGVGLGRAGVAAAIGAVAYGAAKAGAEAAGDYQTSFARFRTMNLGADVDRRADAFARRRDVFGVSQREKMDTLRESVGLFGNMDHAEELSPMLAQLNKANAALYHGKVGEIDEGATRSLMRFIDRRGGTHDVGTFKRNLNLAQRMVNASGGFISFSDLDQFSQYGGTAFRSLSDQGIVNMAALMQEQGGGKAGQAMMSVYQNLVAGRASKKALVELQELGLGQMQYEKHAMVGGKPFKTLTLKSIQQGDLLRADPVAWVRDVLIPTLAKKGITDQQKQLAVVNDFLSNRSASGQMGIMTTQQLQILRDAKLTQNAMGADETINVWKGTYGGQQANFLAAWENFKTAYGERILPGATRLLETGTQLLQYAEKVSGNWIGGGAAMAGGAMLARRIFGGKPPAPPAGGSSGAPGGPGMGGGVPGMTVGRRMLSGAKYGAVAGAATELVGGGIDLWNIAHDNNLTKQERNIALTERTGGMAGGIAGMAAGAAIGSVVPVIGTAIGAAIGGAIGGFGGDALGRWIGHGLGEKWFGTPPAHADQGAPQPVGQALLNQPQQMEAAVNKGMTDAIKSTRQQLELQITGHLSYDKPPTLQITGGQGSVIKSNVGFTMQPQ